VDLDGIGSWRVEDSTPFADARQAEIKNASDGLDIGLCSSRTEQNWKPTYEPTKP